MWVGVGVRDVFIKKENPKVKNKNISLVDTPVEVPDIPSFSRAASTED